MIAPWVFVRDLQSHSHTWSAELYNCNAFVGDVAKFMGMKVPGVFADLSEGLRHPFAFDEYSHPEAEETLTADNVKEMSSPTRDGRSMINNKVYTIRPDGTPASQVAASSPPPTAPSSSAKVSIGSMQVSGKPAHRLRPPLLPTNENDGLTCKTLSFGR